MHILMLEDWSYVVDECSIRTLHKGLKLNEPDEIAMRAIEDGAAEALGYAADDDDAPKAAPKARRGRKAATPEGEKSGEASGASGLDAPDE